MCFRVCTYSKGVWTERASAPSPVSPSPLGIFNFGAQKEKYTIHMEVLHAWEPNKGSFMKKSYRWFFRSWQPILFVWSFQFQIENPLFYPEKIYVQYVYISEKFFKRNLSISAHATFVSLRYISFYFASLRCTMYIARTV